MKLIEALNILKSPIADGVIPWKAALVCGFTPAHLETLLAAELRLLAPERRPMIETGLYGDCLGNLERLLPAPPHAVAVVLEWSDLDPRLGLRHLGGWTIEGLADILKTVSARVVRFSEAIERMAALAPVALCLPTLPIPPAAHLPMRQAGTFDLGLREGVATFAGHISTVPGVRIVSPQRLDELSPPRDRLDVRTDLSSGFPYRIPHASAVAESLARLLWAPAPKKGLITDLDDTVWRGIVGDVGVDAISWDLHNHSQAHGLYQQFLGSLADAGVLIAAASKNDPQIVKGAFERADMILSKESVFPMEVGWGPKSEAVTRILRCWNIASNSVVFIDDSPMELAEVAAAYPDLECVLFPKNNDQAVYELLGQLREVFGKSTISRDDVLRLESLRRSPEWVGKGEGGSAPPDDFLAELKAEITLSTAKNPPDPRALDLINKTNQFNLNGHRYTEGEWLAHLRNPEAFLLLVSYQDKFGPLGTIAVLTGCSAGGTVTVDQWVMSCRAFSRRIEHQCLSVLFDVCAADRIAFAFQATSRNGLVRDFFAGFLDSAPELGLLITREMFHSRCPPLNHQIKGFDAWQIRNPA